MKLMQKKLSTWFQLIIDSDLMLLRKKKKKNNTFSYSKDNGALRLKHLNNDEELQVNFL